MANLLRNYCMYGIALAIVSLLWVSPLFSNVVLQKSIARKTSDNSADSTNSVIYEKHGIRVNYPSDWTVSEDNFNAGYSVIFSPSSDSPAYVKIGRIISAGLPSEEIFGLTLDHAKNRDTNFELISSDHLTFQGNPAYKIEYTYDDKDSGPLHTVETVVISGDNNYHLSYTAPPDQYSDLFSQAQNVISSFEITDPSSDASPIGGNMTDPSS